MRTQSAVWVLIESGERAKDAAAAERDLAEAREPIAIPIFGRGRALYAFLGAGLTTANIDQAARFLIGKCSCQVKELNPGVELLFAADWEALVKANAGAPPDLPTLAELARSVPETVVFGEGATETKRAKRIPDSVLLGVGAFGVLLAMGGMWGMVRK